MRYFPYGSYQVYYESHSAGRPLILLHGNTASGRMFDPIIPVLAEKYRIRIYRHECCEKQVFCGRKYGNGKSFQCSGQADRI